MKSPITAFFLSFIPGAGHIYLGKKLRGYVYLTLFIASIVSGFFIAVISNHIDPLIVGLVIAFLTGIISMIDMVILLINRVPAERPAFYLPGQTNDVSQVTPTDPSQQQVQGHDQIGQTQQVDDQGFATILLSFIPGLGHFQLGLMNRGLTFLIGFSGLAMMIIFVSLITGQSGFAVFLGILPIIWIYNMFDITQLLARRRAGETLVDRTILEDFAEHDKGKKSKALATILSIFPGAGHMYLGLQKRGFQLMAAFLLSIYILDTLRLSLFLFLIPLIWFFSFFDALQKVAQHGEGELQDVPIISYLVNHQKWLGAGLIAMGLYYLLDNILIPSISESIYRMFNINIARLFEDYFQMAVVCLLLIGGGLKLLWGSKKKK